MAGPQRRGGGGGTAIATAAMRPLPVGFPKLMVSTLASGQTAHYAWRQAARGQLGRALQWWLERLAQTGTRQALLNQP